MIAKPFSIKNIIVAILLLANGFLAQAQNPKDGDIVWFTNPDHADWLYKLGEKATIKVQIYQYGILLKAIDVKYSFGLELMPATKTETINLKNGTAEINVGTLDKPGFVDLKLEATINGNLCKHHIKVGFEPEKLKPYTQYPTDFKAFWDAAKAEAAKCPMKVERTLVPEYCNDKINVYLVKVQAYKEDNAIYGYLSMPKKEGKYPVVFTPPGAGIHVVDPTFGLFYAEGGMIKFETEIHGIRPDLDAKTYKEIARSFGGGDGSYYVNGIEDKDRYYLKKVYLSCVRAIDYLTSLPEWDGKNVIAQGGSQGGALALVTTALDPRVTICAASYPAMSDMAGYLDNRAGGYPHLFTQYKGMDKPEIMKTLQYYDVVNFAKNINVPVFMTWGFNDDTCPPTTSYIDYNVIKSDKKALITPVNEHWSSDTTKKAIFEWIKTRLK
jgi:cephalosporin-C deacetylase